jgi:dienelactone hydrolase
MAMQTVLVVLLVLVLCPVGEAATKTENVAYRSGDTALQGYLAYDSRAAGARPGILVFPEWWGVNDYPRERARQLAQMGYVAFVADMYGKGVVATTPDEAGKLAGQFRSRWDQGGRDEMRRRAQAGLDVLARDPG